MHTILHRLSLFLFALLLSLAAWAQGEVTVRSFHELTNDLSARTNRRFDLNDEACALIKVMFPTEGASFEGNVVGDSEFRTSEYWVYLAQGTKRLRLHLPGQPTILVEFANFGVERVQSNVTYILEFKFPRRGLSASFYADAGFRVGSPMGIELALGTYLGGFNLEAEAMLPVSGSDDLHWNSPDYPSALCIYKPAFSLGGRLGYGIRMLHDKLRLTPQAGVRFLKTHESESADGLIHADGCYCTSVALALKAQFFLGRHFTIGLVPEYDIPVMQSDGFRMLSEASSVVKGWGGGFGAKLSIGIEF